MAVIGHDGSVLTLTTWRGAPRPPMCWVAPDTPKATYRSGSMATPVVPIWRSWPIQPASVATRVAPADAPSAAATRPSRAKIARACRSRAPRGQPGAAAEHPGGVGQVHGGRVGLEDARMTSGSGGQAGCPGPPTASRRGDHRRLARSTGRSAGTTVGSRATRVATAGPSDVDRDQRPGRPAGAARPIRTPAGGPGRAPHRTPGRASGRPSRPPAGAPGPVRPG